MDMKKMLAALDGVESAQGTASSVAQKGSMKSLLESIDSVVEGGMKDTVTGMQEHLHDFAQEIQRGMHGHDAVVDELNDLFDEVVEMGDPVVTNAFKVLRTLEPEDFGEGEGGGPNRASMVAQDAMDMIDGSDDSDYDHLPKIGEEELEEAQSPAQKAAFEKMLAAKKGNKDDDKDEVDESEEAVAEEELEEAIMVSAEGAEAAELLAILKNAGMPEPAMPAMPEPEMEDTEYANSPDEETFGMDAVIASGDDLNKSKEAYADVDGGDNPMETFEGKFKAMLDEMLAEDEESTEEVVAEETEEVVAEEELEEATDEVVEADDQGLSRFLKMAGI